MNRRLAPTRISAPGQLGASAAALAASSTRLTPVTPMMGSVPLAMPQTQAPSAILESFTDIAFASLLRYMPYMKVRSSKS